MGMSETPNGTRQGAQGSGMHEMAQDAAWHSRCTRYEHEVITTRLACLVCGQGEPRARAFGWRYARSGQVRTPYLDMDERKLLVRNTFAEGARGLGGTGSAVRGDMDTIMILASGVWIHPVDSERFRFSGSVADFLSILVSHPELDIDSAQFLVHVTQNTSSLPAHGFGGHARSGGDL
mgnify:CR=1 FL=1